MTSAEAGNHSTAPRATPPVGAAQGRDLRSREALVSLTAWIVSVVLAVLPEREVQAAGAKAT